MGTRVVGLLGGECTGKSTLAAALADSLPAVVAAEALRDYVATHGRSPAAGEQIELVAAQQRAVAVAAAEAADRGLSWVVADPSPLMTAVYSIVYFGDRGLLAPAVDALDGTEVMLALADDLPWQPDPGMRDGEEFRRAAQEVIERDVVSLLERRGIAVHHVRGDTNERLAVVHALLRTRQPLRIWRGCGR